MPELLNCLVSQYCRSSQQEHCHQNVQILVQFAATLPRRGEGAACGATELAAGDEVQEAL